MIRSGTIITPDLEPEWLAERDSNLGASEAAGALGVSDYDDQTPIALWQRKLKLAPPVAQNEAMLWGKLLEPMIADQYEQRTGREIVARQLFLRHANYPFLTATLDAVTDCKRIVEIKTIGSERNLGEEGTDEIPEAYLVQTAQQLACASSLMDVAAVDVVFLVAGNRLRIFEDVQKNPGLVDMVVAGGVRFWDHVQRREPPIWGRMTPKDLLFLHPECEGVVELDGEIMGLVQAYEESKQRSSLMEACQEEFKIQILEALGGAEIGLLPDGRRVKRFVQEVPERTLTTKGYTKTFFKVLKGSR